MRAVTEQRKEDVGSGPIALVVFPGDVWQELQKLSERTGLPPMVVLSRALLEFEQRTRTQR